MSFLLELHNEYLKSIPTQWITKAEQALGIKLELIAYRLDEGTNTIICSTPDMPQILVRISADDTDNEKVVIRVAPREAETYRVRSEAYPQDVDFKTWLVRQEWFGDVWLKMRNQLPGAQTRQLSELR